MSLSKKPLARVVVYDPKTRKSFWQGTVYRNKTKTVNEVVKKIKGVLE